jgi:hypothetical protein
MIRCFYHKAETVSSEFFQIILGEFTLKKLILDADELCILLKFESLKTVDSSVAAISTPTSATNFTISTIFKN